LSHTSSPIALQKTRGSLTSKRKAFFFLFKNRRTSRNGSRSFDNRR
jgi:hypothetical protein